MKYVLDTNTLSFAMGGDPSVCEQLLRHARMDVLLPQPVIAEIEYGLMRLPESKKRARLRQRFQVFLDEMERTPWTDEVSQAFGQIKATLEQQGNRLEDLDIAVAAHALAIDGTLVTDNLDHMKRVPSLKVQNWRTRPAGSSGSTDG